MLTHVQIAAAKPLDRPITLSDQLGLHLVVQPNGSKHWRVRYRFVGRQKTLHLGRYPDISIADARRRRDEARQQIAAGIDPSAEKRRARVMAQIAAGSTFRGVAEEWVAKQKREGLAGITIEKIEWLLDMAYRTLASRPINEIDALEVLTALRRVEANGRYESARRMRSVLSRVFRYGIATARCDRDVAADLRGALTTPKPKYHAAITTAKEAGALMRAIDGYKGHAITLLALKLTPHVFVRPGELRQAEWEEFDFDRPIWSIPAEKMKMRRPHRVPLSNQVLTILEELNSLSGSGRYLFPSFRTWKRPMSENSVNAAPRRLGYSQQQMTAHGFRAMAATLLNEMGKWAPDAIERQLAHQESGVRAAYARGEYWDERVAMMQYWSDHLDSLREAAPSPDRRFPQRVQEAGSKA